MSKTRLQAFEPLFHAPLICVEIANFQALNALLLPEIAALRAASPGMTRSNRGGWHSNDDFFLRQEPGCRTLAKELVEALKLATRKVSPDFDFGGFNAECEGWINVLASGGLNTPHDHPGWVWSGCYYVSTPEADHPRSGNIEFIDGRTNLQALTLPGASCFNKTFAVRPRAGTVLMFPSWLAHWVTPNESAEERVSIAFNARFRARTGS